MPRAPRKPFNGNLTARELGERLAAGLRREITPMIAVVAQGVFAVCDLCDEEVALLALTGCNGSFTHVGEDCMVRMRELVKKQAQDFHEQSRKKR